MHWAAESRSLPVGSGTLAATLVLAPPLAGLLWLSGAVSIHAAVGAMTLFVFVVMLAGFLLLRAADAGASSRGCDATISTRCSTMYRCTARPPA